MQRKLLNVTTGEESIVDFTPEEISAVYLAAPDPATEAIVQQFTAEAMAVFGSMSLGEQALWSHVYQAVDSALSNGDMGTVTEIILTVPPLYGGAEAIRSQLIALLPTSPPSDEI